MKTLFSTLLLAAAMAATPGIAQTATQPAGSPASQPAPTSPAPAKPSRYVYSKEVKESGKTVAHCFDTEKQKKVKSKKCDEAGVPKP